MLEDFNVGQRFFTVFLLPQLCFTLFWQNTYSQIHTRVTVNSSNKMPTRFKSISSSSILFFFALALNLASAQTNVSINTVPSTAQVFSCTGGTVIITGNAANEVLFLTPDVVKDYSSKCVTSIILTGKFASLCLDFIDLRGNLIIQSLLRQ
jgi:ABC-type long-subunit fatty acid transport system fused permease/ATPase subunit